MVLSAQENHFVTENDVTWNSLGTNENDSMPLGNGDIALNAWTEYEFTEQWEVGLGTNWLGARYADSGQTATMPGYVVWNAMTSYKLSKTVFLQLNVNNIANRLYYDNSYYTSPSENHVIPGAGRTAKLTLRTTF